MLPFPLAVEGLAEPQPGREQEPKKRPRHDVRGHDEPDLIVGQHSTASLGWRARNSGGQLCRRGYRDQSIRDRVTKQALEHGQQGPCRRPATGTPSKRLGHAVTIGTDDACNVRGLYGPDAPIAQCWYNGAI